jgi:hypothetical protein
MLRHQAISQEKGIRFLKLRDWPVDFVALRSVSCETPVRQQPSPIVWQALSSDSRGWTSPLRLLLEPGPGSLTETLGNLRAIATEHLSNLRRLVSHPENVDSSCSRGTLRHLQDGAVSENGKMTYRYHGKVDFFGDRAMAGTDGAGGPGCTTRRVEFEVSLAA